MAFTREFIRELKEYIEERLTLQLLTMYQPFDRFPVAAQESVGAAEIEEYIGKRRKEAFQKLLFSLIDQTGLTDVEIYRRAGLDRRHFSKIRSRDGYRPQKTTVVALILALELNPDRAEELLDAGGYSLSYSETFDLVIRFCLEREIYDLFDVNELLHHVQEKPLLQY